jgi:GNAT superfamily N-acetyltransferase
MCRVHEVSGIEYAKVIHALNGLSPQIFPALTEDHLREGHWFIIFNDRNEPKAFAGIVPMTPFDELGIWYLKRCYVDPHYRGRGWQKLLLRERIAKAKSIGAGMLVTESIGSHSNVNMASSGFVEFIPEQPWGKPGSRYWKMVL